MNSKGCPICGYKDITVLDEHNCTTFEICPSCGCESGYAYDTNSSQEHLKYHREKWAVNNKYKWWSSTTSPPKNWNPKEQMKQANINAPK